MSKSTNYAVLFSGGANLSNNHSRYYDSIKENYELLLDRGVPAENITIAYAAGVQDPSVEDPRVGMSPTFDSHVQLTQYINSDMGINDFYSKFNLSNNNNFKDEFENLISILEPPVNGEVKGINEIRSTSFVYYSFDDDNSADAFRQSVDEARTKVNDSIDQSNISVTTKFKPAVDIPGMYILDINVYSKSDLSFATDKNTTVVEATKDSLQKVVGGQNNPSKDSLFGKISENDSLYVWTFDHGTSNYAGNNVADMVPPDYRYINGANLTPWGAGEISSSDFANIFEDVTFRSKNTTFAFAQCYSGGLLQAISVDTGYGDNWFGMAATNQFETSLNSDFADGIVKGLKKGVNTGGELFDIAKKADKSSSPLQYEGNEYPEGNWGVFNEIEHPWSYGSGELPIFANGGASRGRDLQGIKLLNQESLADSQFAFSFSSSVSEDQIVDLFGRLKPLFGDLSDLSFVGYAPSVFGTIDYDEKADSLTYDPINDFNGQDSVVLRFDDGDISFDIKVDIDVESVNDAPMAVDDFVQISSGERDVLIDVDDAPGFLDDTDVDGDELSIASYSAPDNGTIEKIGDFLFEYQPNAGFVGSDSFLYVLSDGVAFDVAEVFINVVDSTL